MCTFRFGLAGASFAVLFASFPAAYAQSTKGGLNWRARVYNFYSPYTYTVESVGTLYNGERENGFGTGFVVDGRGYLITAAHVVLDGPSRYQSLQIKVRGEYVHDAPAEVVAIDRTLDVALLKFRGVTTSGEQIEGHRNSAVSIRGGPEIAEPIVVLGFPLKLPGLSVAPGYVTAKGEKPYSWRTDAALNPGNSGGPVINKDGFCIGILVSGIVYAEIEGFGSVPVLGIKNFHEMKSFFARDEVKKLDLSGPGLSSPFDILAVAEFPPDVLPTNYSFSESRDGGSEASAPHAGVFTRTFEAIEGYEIQSAKLDVQSLNNARDIKVAIADDRKSVAVRFNLDSGSSSERERSWISGSINTQQQYVFDKTRFNRE